MYQNNIYNKYKTIDPTIHHIVPGNRNPNPEITAGTTETHFQGFTVNTKYAHSNPNAICTLSSPVSLGKVLHVGCHLKNAGIQLHAKSNKDDEEEEEEEDDDDIDLSDRDWRAFRAQLVMDASTTGTDAEKDDGSSTMSSSSSSTSTSTSSKAEIITDENDSIPKSEIIKNAKNNNLFTPKSTCHLIYCNSQKKWFPMKTISTIYKIDQKRNAL